MLNQVTTPKDKITKKLLLPATGIILSAGESF